MLLLILIPKNNTVAESKMNRFLALMMYVAVFLGGFTLTASLGLPGVTHSVPETKVAERISKVVLQIDHLDNVDNHVAAFKVVAKKKVKKRYQGRWCEFSPRPLVYEKPHIVYDDVVVYCVLRSVIHERCIRTFGLRGPPACIAA